MQDLTISFNFKFANFVAVRLREGIMAHKKRTKIPKKRATYKLAVCNVDRSSPLPNVVNLDTNEKMFISFHCYHV